jgi:hypothetical protein
MSICNLKIGTNDAHKISTFLMPLHEPLPPTLLKNIQEVS